MVYVYSKKKKKKQRREMEVVLECTQDKKNTDVNSCRVD